MARSLGDTGCLRRKCDTLDQYRTLHSKRVGRQHHMLCQYRTLCWYAVSVPDCSTRALTVPDVPVPHALSVLDTSTIRIFRTGRQYYRRSQYRASGYCA
eukprot:435542-Rhodomonas_salina.1